MQRRKSVDVLGSPNPERFLPWRTRKQLVVIAAAFVVAFFVSVGPVIAQPGIFKIFNPKYWDALKNADQVFRGLDEVHPAWFKEHLTGWGSEMSNLRSVSSSWTPRYPETLQVKKLDSELRALYKHSRAPVSPRLVLQVPTNSEEFQNVYGWPPSAAEAQAIRRFNQRAAKARLKPSVPSYNDDRPLVVMMAHSVEGGKVLILPNGTRLPTSGLQGYCLREGIRCAFLTCNSEDFSIKGKISMEAALEMWSKALSKYERSGAQMSGEEFLLAMVSARRTQTLKKGLYVAGVVGATGSGYMVISSGGKN